MDNAPPHGFLQEAHAVVGTWDDGRSVYDDQADAVDRLMTGYHDASQQNAAYLDTWSVPPTVAVGTASAASGGVGGAGVGAMPDTAGVAPAGGSGTGGAAAATTTPQSSSRAGSPGMHAPMMGAGAGGGQCGERRRPSYLVDDSDAFVDRRWIQPAVITPEDLIRDEHGRYPGQ